MRPEWLMEGARKDAQSVTADWVDVREQRIDGVLLRESKVVGKPNGYVVEVFRSDWFDEPQPVDQVFITALTPGGVSAWHAHGTTVDRLFVSSGRVLVALYDGRGGSPTQGVVNTFVLGDQRPGLVVVPPGIWHGVRNVGEGTAQVINAVDVAYRYEDPDHWRVPADSGVIPFDILA